MNITYRIATYNDLDGIIKLYEQFSPGLLFNKEKVNNTWFEIEKNEKYKIFIALDSNFIVSTCQIAIIPSLTYNGRAFAIIENVITDINYRNKGIGKNILLTSINFARLKSCYKVMVMCYKENIEANLLYQSVGFDCNKKNGYELKL